MTGRLSRGTETRYISVCFGVETNHASGGQGVAESSFTTEYPDQAARIVISLLEDLAYAFSELVEDIDTLPHKYGRCFSVLPR
jgi:hypothetical protein